MKHELFNSIVSTVCKRFDINKEDVFRRTKKRIPVDARQFITLLSSRAGIKIPYLTKYFEDEGLNLNRSTIERSIEAAEKSIAED